MPIEGALAVTVEEHLLVGTSYSTQLSERLRPFTVTCRFCPTVRRYQQVVSYWAHLKVQHAELATNERLHEVQHSARQYKAYAEDRYYDTPSSNPSTWAKIQQALGTNFSWEVVQNWRLPKDTVQAGRGFEDGGAAC